MVDGKPPIAAIAADAPKRPRPTSYPEPFASRVIRNEKRPLGDLFGLTHFGVNLTRPAAFAHASKNRVRAEKGRFKVGRDCSVEVFLGELVEATS